MTRGISYRLPVAELAVSGTVRRTRDTIKDDRPLAQQPTALVSHSFVLRHVASSGAYTVALPHGWLRTFKASFSFTPDRRLVAATAESTGQLGTILTAAATIVGTALGGAVKAGAGVALSPSAQDPVEVKYSQDHPGVCSRRKRTMQLLEKLQQAQLAAADEILADPANTAVSAARWDLLQRVKQSLEGELDVLDAHFAAWRAATIKTVDETFEFTVPLTGLGSSAGEPGDACTKTSPEAPKTLADLWTRYGVGVAVTWSTARGKKQIAVTPKRSQIATRTPDPVTISIIEHQQGVPVVTASSRHLVMDDRSKIEYFPMEKSLFGRRSLALNFDENGCVTGVAVEGAASLAEAASAFAQLPAAVGSGVGSVNTAVSGLATARRAAQEAELTQVKQLVELEQQKITEAGMHATAADAARLQRLQQLKALLNTQTAISKADPRLVSLLNAGTDQD